jgi:hypothetical protein
MKSKISVLGSTDNIIIPKIIPSWKWLSPQLLQMFLDVFENGKRDNILPLLEDQLNNSQFCPKHNIFYYSRYSECPLCNDLAKVIAAPVIIQAANSAGLRIAVIFEARDIKILFSKLHYLSTSGEFVHVATQRRIKHQKGIRVDFSDDGSFVFWADKETITIIGKQDNILSNIDRMYNTPYIVRGNDLYYVDKSNTLTKITVTERGNIPSTIAQVYNPIFEVSSTGKTFIASLYPKKAIIAANKYNFELNYTGKIKEYAIKYDPISDKWLFVYLKANGKYRTIVFGDKVIEYDNDILMYNATPLSSICFYNNTIYDPADKKIIGINYIKNQSKEFQCVVVNESSRLEFANGGFHITNEDKIYSFGK